MFMVNTKINKVLKFLALNISQKRVIIKLDTYPATLNHHSDSSPRWVLSFGSVRNNDINLPSTR